jgi:putative hydrolase of the HAD superfamily
MQSNRTVPVISFDLDGTLVTTGFADAVWLDEIPRRYARRHRMSRSRAQREVERAYASIGPEALEWYDIHYWLDRFDLDADWRELLRDRLGDLRLYEDVSGTLDALAGYRLIVVSNAAAEFIETEMEVLGIADRFHRIFSAVSDFGATKKDAAVFHAIGRKLDIAPAALVHVGDSYDFDYEAARRAGARAFFLDRSRTHTAPHVVHDLLEFSERCTGVRGRQQDQTGD